jgi:hypothetical protein
MSTSCSTRWSASGDIRNAGVARWFGGAAAARCVADALPGAQLVGQGRLSWWGFTAYDARLWAMPSLTRGAFGAHPFMLELQPQLRENLFGNTPP